MREKSMFCYQCEQKAKGEGCTRVGVVAKSPKVQLFKTFSFML